MGSTAGVYGATRQINPRSWSANHLSAILRDETRIFSATDGPRTTDYTRTSEPKGGHRGYGSPLEEKTSQKSPCLIVECKNEAVEISVKDYFQGESYARAVGCEFLVCTNRRHTYVFKLVPGAPGQIIGINEIPRCSDWANEQRLQEIRQGLRAFNRSEFQNLLFDCHNILRDVHKIGTWPRIRHNIENSFHKDVR